MLLVNLGVEIVKRIVPFELVAVVGVVMVKIQYSYAKFSDKFDWVTEFLGLEGHIVQARACLF